MSTSVLSPVIYYVCSKRCGEIRMTPDASNFQLICEFCTNVFEELQEFSKHIKMQKCLYRSIYMRAVQTAEIAVYKRQKLDVVEQQQQTLQIKKPLQQPEIVTKYTTVRQLLEESDEKSLEAAQEEQDKKVNLEELTKQLESEQLETAIDPLEFTLVSVKEEPQLEDNELSNELSNEVSVRVETLAKPTVTIENPMLNTREKFLTFIENIKRSPILWHYADASSMDKELKIKIHKEIADIMNFKFHTSLTEENIKKQVHSLHKYWLKMKSGKCQKPWFYELLTFFDGVTTTAEDNLMPTRAQFIHLLDLYRKYEVLWNCKHLQYMNNFEQSYAYTEIAKSMNQTFKDCNFTKSTIKNKLTRLQTRYRKMNTGKIPRFWYYGKMKFLDITNYEEILQVDNINWQMELSQSRIFHAVDKLLSQTSVAVLNDIAYMAKRHEIMDSDYMSSGSDFEGFPEDLNTTKDNTDLSSAVFEDDLNGSAQSSILKKVKDKAAANADEITFALIELYRTKPILWDRMHADFYTMNLRAQHQEEIVVALNERFKLELTLGDIRKRIRAVRDVFSKSYTKSKFYNKLTFLPLIRIRYKCQHCEQTFQERAKLYMHEYTHTLKKTFACDQCDKCYKRPAQLRHHKLQHLEKHQYPYLCHICGEHFNELPKYKIHTYKMHNVPWPHVCSVCQRGFGTRTQLITHTRTHTGEMPFLCQECGKSFRTLGSIIEHRRRHTKRKTHVCNICDKAYYRSYKLKVHMKTHSNIKEFACNICNKRFTQRYNLNVHLQIHSNERKFSCRLCGKRFKQRAACFNHMRKQHRLVK